MKIKVFKSHVNSHSLSAFYGPLLLEDAVQPWLLREPDQPERGEGQIVC